jgi:CHAT domain-containing protein/tetratricopeptide (TPR) repeat protein
MTPPPPKLRRASRLLAIAVCLAGTAAIGQVPSTSDWSALDARAMELYVKGDLPGAIASAQAALRAASTPGETGRSLDRLGFFHHQSGNVAEGEKHLRESLQIRETAFGTESLEYAETANDLALLLRDRRQLDEAKALAERAVATRLRLLGANDPLVAESLNTNGGAYAFAGDYRTAVSFFERALAIHESRPIEERTNEEYGTLCISLAGTYQRLGKYALAQSTFEKGLGVLRVKPGRSHPVYAVSLLALASLQTDLGHYVDAERLYDEAGRLVEAAFSKDHPMYSAMLNNRGFFFYSVGNLAAAEANYRLSLELKRKNNEPAVSVASSLRNLAQITYARDPREGEQHLREAVAAYAEAATAPPFDHAKVLLGLARAQRDRGALPDAQATIEQALAIVGKGLGTRHALYAATVRDLGLVQAANGDRDNAERNLREAIAIAEHAHGAEHPDMAPFLETLGAFYAERGSFAAAEPLYRRSMAIRDRFLDDVLDIGSESFKATLMATALDPTSALIEFQTKATAQVPQARALAFEFVTQRKGRVLEHVRNWRQELRENASDSVRRQLNDWQAILACRTSLTLAIGDYDLRPPIVGACGLDGTDLAGRYEQLLNDVRARRTDDLAAQVVKAIAVLKERGDAIEASLNRETGGVTARSAPVSVDDIRAQLQEDELLVEFVSYGAGRSLGGIRRYGAFVVDNTGTVGWSDVGAAAPIDAAVRDLLAAANDWSVSLRNREERSAAASERTARDVLADLSQKIWTPLKPLVDARPNVRRLRVAPDASLNLVPFEALSDGRDLVERFAITYLPAGRDLAAASTRQPASPAAPVVVVSPGASERSDRAGDAASTFRAGGLARLASATAEAGDFRRVVRGSELYAQANATERRVKGIHGPTLLHIVGHGVVHGASAGTADAMALSAIVLEEAYGRASGSSDDGMLTPLELQNVDLRATEMLVLSQCQMASGVASVGEGVYGMRRAAAIAGASTFVAPLWNVEDRVQRTLMQRFYSGLAAGQTRAEALRGAKLTLRRSPSTRSFLYWAPVILSGSASALPAALFQAPSN